MSLQDIRSLLTTYEAFNYIVDGDRPNKSSTPYRLSTRASLNTTVPTSALSLMNAYQLPYLVHKRYLKSEDLL